ERNLAVEIEGKAWRMFWLSSLYTACVEAYVRRKLRLASELAYYETISPLANLAELTAWGNLLNVYGEFFIFREDDEFLQRVVSMSERYLTVFRALTIEGLASGGDARNRIFNYSPEDTMTQLLQVTAIAYEALGGVENCERAVELFEELVEYYKGLLAGSPDNQDYQENYRSVVMHLSRGLRLLATTLHRDRGAEADVSGRIDGLLDRALELDAQGLNETPEATDAGATGDRVLGIAGRFLRRMASREASSEDEQARRDAREAVRAHLTPSEVFISEDYVTAEKALQSLLGDIERGDLEVGQMDDKTLTFLMQCAYERGHLLQQLGRDPEIDERSVELFFRMIAELERRRSSGDADMHLAVSRGVRRSGSRCHIDLTLDRITDILFRPEQWERYSPEILHSMMRFAIMFGPQDLNGNTLLLRHVVQNHGVLVGNAEIDAGKSAIDPENEEFFTRFEAISRAIARENHWVGVAVARDLANICADHRLEERFRRCGPAINGVPAQSLFSLSVYQGAADQAAQELAQRIPAGQTTASEEAPSAAFIPALEASIRDFVESAYVDTYVHLFISSNEDAREVFTATVRSEREVGQIVEDPDFRNVNLYAHAAETVAHFGDAYPSATDRRDAFNATCEAMFARHRGDIDSTEGRFDRTENKRAAMDYYVHLAQIAMHAKLFRDAARFYRKALEIEVQRRQELVDAGTITAQLVSSDRLRLLSAYAMALLFSGEKREAWRAFDEWGLIAQRVIDLSSGETEPSSPDDEAQVHDMVMDSTPEQIVEFLMTAGTYNPGVRRALRNLCRRYADALPDRREPGAVHHFALIAFLTGEREAFRAIAGYILEQPMAAIPMRFSIMHSMIMRNLGYDHAHSGAAAGTTAETSDRAYQRSLDILDNALPWSTPARMSFKMEEANRLIVRGEYQEALERANEAAAYIPDEPQCQKEGFLVFVGSAIAHERNGNHERALTELRKGLANEAGLLQGPEGIKQRSNEAEIKFGNSYALRMFPEEIKAAGVGLLVELVLDRGNPLSADEFKIALWMLECLVDDNVISRLLEYFEPDNLRRINDKRDVVLLAFLLDVATGRRIIVCDVVESACRRITGRVRRFQGETEAGLARAREALTANDYRDMAEHLFEQDDAPRDRALTRLANAVRETERKMAEIRSRRGTRRARSDDESRYAALEALRGGLAEVHREFEERKAELDTIRALYAAGSLDEASARCGSYLDAHPADSAAKAIQDNLPACRRASELAGRGDLASAKTALEAAPHQDRVVTESRGRIEVIEQAAAAARTHLEAGRFTTAEQVLNRITENESRRNVAGAEVTRENPAVAGVYQGIDTIKAEVARRASTIAESGDIRVINENAQVMMRHEEARDEVFRALLQKAAREFNRTAEVSGAPHEVTQRREELFRLAFNVARLVLEHYQHAPDPNYLELAQRIIQHAAANVWVPRLEADFKIIQAMAAGDEAREKRKDRRNFSFNGCYVTPDSLVLRGVVFRRGGIRRGDLIMVKARKRPEAAADEEGPQAPAGKKAKDRQMRDAAAGKTDPHAAAGEEAQDDEEEETEFFIVTEADSRTGVVKFDLPPHDEDYESRIEDLQTSFKGGGTMSRVRDVSWINQRDTLQKVLRELKGANGTTGPLMTPTKKGGRLDLGEKCDDPEKLRPIRTQFEMAHRAMGIMIDIPDDKRQAEIKEVNVYLEERVTRLEENLGLTLSDEQRASIVNGANPLIPFSLFQGPPGTGKTTVMALMIITVVAVAGDNRIRQILGTGAPSIRGLSQTHGGIDQLILRMVQNINRLSDEELKKKFDEANFLYARVGNRSDKIHPRILELHGRKKEILAAIVKEEVTNMITGTTGGMFSDADFMRFFDRLIQAHYVTIDEGSRATVAETFLPLCRLQKICSATLGGDHAQLPANGVNDEDANNVKEDFKGGIPKGVNGVVARKGRVFVEGPYESRPDDVTPLNEVLPDRNARRQAKRDTGVEVDTLDRFRISLLEQVLDLFGEYDVPEEECVFKKTRIDSHFFPEQWRSGRDLVAVSQPFYGGRLKAMNDYNGVLIEDDTGRKNPEGADGNSRINRGEANRIVTWVDWLVNHEHLSSENIAVISPYKAQVNLANRMLYTLARIHQALRVIENGGRLTDEEFSALRGLLEDELSDDGPIWIRIAHLYHPNTPQKAAREAAEWRGPLEAFLAKRNDPEGAVERAKAVRMALKLGEDFIPAEDFSNGSLRIQTVDSAIGSEWKAVVVSWVVSNPKQEVGFLASPIDGRRRMNVGLSRAQVYLINIWDRQNFTRCGNKGMRELAGQMVDAFESSEYATGARTNGGTPYAPREPGTTPIGNLDPLKPFETVPEDGTLEPKERSSPSGEDRVDPERATIKTVGVDTWHDQFVNWVKGKIADGTIQEGRDVVVFDEHIDIGDPSEAPDHGNWIWMIRKGRVPVGKIYVVVPPYTYGAATWQRDVNVEIVYDLAMIPAFKDPVVISFENDFVGYQTQVEVVERRLGEVARELSGKDIEIEGLHVTRYGENKDLGKKGFMERILLKKLEDEGYVIEGRASPTSDQDDLRPGSSFTLASLVESMEQGVAVIEPDGNEVIETPWGSVDLKHLNGIGEHENYKGRQGIFYLARDIEVAMAYGYIVLTDRRKAATPGTLLAEGRGASGARISASGLFNVFSTEAIQRLNIEYQEMSWRRFFEAEKLLGAKKAFETYRGVEGQKRLTKMLDFTSSNVLGRAFGDPEFGDETLGWQVPPSIRTPTRRPKTARQPPAPEDEEELPVELLEDKSMGPHEADLRQAEGVIRDRVLDAEELELAGIYTGDGYGSPDEFPPVFDPEAYGDVVKFRGLDQYVVTAAQAIFDRKAQAISGRPEEDPGTEARDWAEEVVRDLILEWMKKNAEEKEKPRRESPTAQDDPSVEAEPQPPSLTDAGFMQLSLGERLAIKVAIEVTSTNTEQFNIELTKDDEGPVILMATRVRDGVEKRMTSLADRVRRNYGDRAVIEALPSVYGQVDDYNARRIRVVVQRYRIERGAGAQRDADETAEKAIEQFKILLDDILRKFTVLKGGTDFRADASVPNFTTTGLAAQLQTKQMRIGEPSRLKRLIREGDLDSDTLSDMIKSKIRQIENESRSMPGGIALIRAAITNLGVLSDEFDKKVDMPPFERLRFIMALLREWHDKAKQSMDVSAAKIVSIREENAELQEKIEDIHFSERWWRKTVRVYFGIRSSAEKSILARINRNRRRLNGELKNRDDQGIFINTFCRFWYYLNNPGKNMTDFMNRKLSVRTLRRADRTEPLVLFVDQLTPEEIHYLTGHYNIRALITHNATSTSHWVIAAKDVGVPILVLDLPEREYEHCGQAITRLFDTAIKNKRGDSDWTPVDSSFTDEINREMVFVRSGTSENAEITFCPGQTTVDVYKRSIARQRALQEYIEERVTDSSKAVKMGDTGQTVDLMANVENVDEARLAVKGPPRGGRPFFAAGIGLFRTEYMWTDEYTLDDGQGPERPLPAFLAAFQKTRSDALANRQVDTAAYEQAKDRLVVCMSNYFKDLANAVGINDPVNIRSIDYQPDKRTMIHNFVAQNSGIRSKYGLAFYESKLGAEILDIQTRAILEARKEHTNLRMHYPMVEQCLDVDRLVRSDDERSFRSRQAAAIRSVSGTGAMAQRMRENLEGMEIGIMVETRKAARNIRSLLQDPDITFYEIGTNDLTRDIMSAVTGLSLDRDNPRDNRYLSRLQPAVLREIKRILREAVRVNKKLVAQGKKPKEICICGEMASWHGFQAFLVDVMDELKATPVILPLTLSMAGSRIPAVNVFLQKLKRDRYPKKKAWFDRFKNGAIMVYCWAARRQYHKKKEFLGNVLDDRRAIPVDDVADDIVENTLNAIVATDEFKTIAERITDRLDSTAVDDLMKEDDPLSTIALVARKPDLDKLPGKRPSYRPLHRMPPSQSEQQPAARAADPLLALLLGAEAETDGPDAAAAEAFGPDAATETFVITDPEGLHIRPKTVLWVMATQSPHSKEVLSTPNPEEALDLYLVSSETEDGMVILYGDPEKGARIMTVLDFPGTGLDQGVRVTLRVERVGPKSNPAEFIGSIPELVFEDEASGKTYGFLGIPEGRGERGDQETDRYSPTGAEKISEDLQAHINEVRGYVEEVSALVKADEKASQRIRDLAREATGAIGGYWQKRLTLKPGDPLWKEDVMAHAFQYKETILGILLSASISNDPEHLLKGGTIKMLNDALFNLQAVVTRLKRVIDYGLLPAYEEELEIRRDVVVRDNWGAIRNFILFGTVSEEFRVIEETIDLKWMMPNRRPAVKAKGLYGEPVDVTIEYSRTLWTSVRDIREVLDIERNTETFLGVNRFFMSRYILDVSRPGTACMLAKIDGKVVGYAVYLAGEHTIDLLHMAVENDYRGGGVGLAMADELKRMMVSGFEEIIGVIHEYDSPSENFFEQNNFETDGRVRNAFGNDDAKIVSHARRYPDDRRSPSAAASVLTQTDTLLFGIAGRTPDEITALERSIRDILGGNIVLKAVEGDTLEERSENLAAFAKEIGYSKLPELLDDNTDSEALAAVVIRYFSSLLKGPEELIHIMDILNNAFPDAAKVDIAALLRELKKETLRYDPSFKYTYQSETANILSTSAITVSATGLEAAMHGLDFAERIKARQENMKGNDLKNE
ncbi:MAG: GNAT family N-acetyltransferase, partial [Candidatus Omnitrophota bacterium]